MGEHTYGRAQVWSKALTATANGVLCVHSALERYKRECGRAGRRLEVDIADLAILPEEIFDVALSSVQGQVAHVDTSHVAAYRFFVT